jgi:hypothetical protein
MDDDLHAVARWIVADDFDLAGQDDSKPAADIADLDQRLADAEGAHLAEPPDPLDLERLIFEVVPFGVSV